MEDQLYIYLTPGQKLAALAARFYDVLNWTPKGGDYYTTSRADFELYRIAKIENGVVYTEYCTRPGHYSEWPQDKFTTEDFGVKRVWVPIWILNPNMTPSEMQAHLVSRVAKQ